jgi:hypothetical protein
MSGLRAQSEQQPRKPLNGLGKTRCAGSASLIPSPCGTVRTLPSWRVRWPFSTSITKRRPVPQRQVLLGAPYRFRFSRMIWPVACVLSFMGRIDYRTGMLVLGFARFKLSEREAPGDSSQSRC